VRSLLRGPRALDWARYAACLPNEAHSSKYLQLEC
jgi:hypothetical protein